MRELIAVCPLGAHGIWPSPWRETRDQGLDHPRPRSVDTAASGRAMRRVWHGILCFDQQTAKMLKCLCWGGGGKRELCFYDEQQPKLATATAVLYSGAASCVQHTYCTKVYVLISLNKKRSLLACEYACDGQRWYARRVLYQDSRRVIAGTLGVSWYARTDTKVGKGFHAVISAHSCTVTATDQGACRS